MGLFIYLLFIFFFFLGVVQVILAIGLAITTKSRPVRKNLGIYGLCVLIYFLGFLVLDRIPDEQDPMPLIITYFFAGAFGLTMYNFYIIAYRNQL